MSALQVPLLNINGCGTFRSEYLSAYPERWQEQVDSRLTTFGGTLNPPSNQVLLSPHRVYHFDVIEFRRSC
jgi:hypothetical protein